MYTLSERSLKNRQGVDNRLIEISDLAITITPIDFGHGDHAGLRGDQEQNNLFKRGLSRCDGYDKISKHQKGLALDFYAYVDGQASWESEHLALVALAFFKAANMLGYDIDWGGFWGVKRYVHYGWDCPHIEISER